MLHEIEENYPFSMPGCLIVILSLFRNLVIVILSGTIYYLKYKKVWGVENACLISLDPKQKHQDQILSKQSEKLANHDIYTPN